MQSGFLIAKLLTSLAAEKNITLNAPLLSSIKNSNTPAARVYNWNIISEVLSIMIIGFCQNRDHLAEITAEVNYYR